LGVARQAGEAAAFRERVEQALSGAAGRARRLGDQALSVAAGAGQAVADAAGRAGAAAGELAGRGPSAAEGAREGAGGAGGQAGAPGSRAAAYLQERFLLLGAVGVAVGAGLGLVLPSSRPERRMLGSVREGVRGGAEEMVRGLGQHVAEAAGRVRAAVAETAAAGREAVRRELSATEPPEQTRPGDPSAAATSPAAEGGPPRP